MAYQLIALALTALWMVVVLIFFRKSVIALIAGLVIIGVFVFVGLAAKRLIPADLGLSPPRSWLQVLGYGGAGAVLAAVYSPLANRFAALLVKEPLNLEAFRPIRSSLAKLAAGIIFAWIFGGVLEEIVVRGIVLKSAVTLLGGWLVPPAAIGIAVVIAGTGAGVMHLYQGKRAVIIITQLSVLFGILFVITGYNLWAVMLCHALFDTIAFIKFARKPSGKTRDMR